MRVYIILFFLLFLNFSSLSAQDIYTIARSGSASAMEKIYTENPMAVNTLNDSGYSPLTLAVYHGNTDIVQYLISKVNSINEVSNYGTPLMAATVKGHKDLVRILLEAGADPNLTDAQDTSPLIYASVFKLNEIAQELIEHKADILHKDKKGYTALDYATLTGNKELITLINNAQ